MSHERDMEVLINARGVRLGQASEKEYKDAMRAVETSLGVR